MSRWSEAAIAHVAPLASGGPLDRSLRVTLSFHPDRVTDGSTVLEHLVRDGVYRSQFETGTSNGGLTAHVGGDRWRWEQRIFGHAYDDAPASERPRYGALDHRRRPIGAAPRFGSSFLRLTEDVLERTTFCFPDSVLEPKAFGTVERCDLVRLADAFGGDLLDDYVEAHVHGPVLIGEDVEALVLDPSFRGTAVETQAAALGVPVTWHEGRVLDVATLAEHPGYRGPYLVGVGRRVAVDGRLDAAVLGRARLAGHEDPDHLKRLWHLVARFGAGSPAHR